MAKQTFTTGQVLTAAQMTSLQQTAMLGGSATAKTASYVLVAADAGTTVAMSAAGATTITVNTGLFAAGDTVFIQNRGAGACTVTAGTATVATAGSLILPQNDAGILYFTATGAATFYDFIQAGAASPLTTKGDLYTFSTSDARLAVGTNTHVLTADSAEATGLKWAAAGGGSSGLNLVTSASFTASAAVAIDNCFTSTYKNYRIIFTVTSGASAMQRMRLRASSADNTTANYYSQFGYFGPANAYGVFSTSAGGYFYMYDGHVDGGHIIIDVLDPQIAQRTRISALSYQDNNYGVAGSGQFATTAQFDGIDFYPASSTLTGTYAVYGYGV
jgi:hypothetical protein